MGIRDITSEKSQKGRGEVERKRTTSTTSEKTQKGRGKVERRRRVDRDHEGPRGGSAKVTALLGKKCHTSGAGHWVKGRKFMGKYTE